ncbi:MAG: efflux RND transporter periplasmic adaptor subunit [Synergistaceae bacterium]|nr:efflux RND transporter periplasmic adaptor subunit [Synergistaceae bacterium]
MKQRKRENRVRGTIHSIFYFIGVAAILWGWVYAFRSYFRHYDSLHPEIAWAVPIVREDIVEVDGVFLWDEIVLTSPGAGKARFPRGRGPVRVEKGAVVARVASANRTYDVKAVNEGYFVAGVDGMENNWRYSSLWLEERELPSVPRVVLIGDGADVKSGAPVGKIVPQPQVLHFVGYADLTGSLEELLDKNRVMVKMDRQDTPSKAEVRVYEKIGYRAKISMSMPWFPPDLTLSRNYKLVIGTGTMSGVSIPETAVINRGGLKGAFVLKGSSTHFSEIKGRAIDDGKYLVTEGLRLGDAVVVDGGTAIEGRVKLW